MHILQVALFHLDSTGRDDLARIVQGCLLSLPHKVPSVIP